MLKPSRRDATAADLAWLVDLRMQTMAGYIAASGKDLSAAEQRARVTQDFECISIITVDGEDVGMIKVVPSETEHKLVQVQVAPAYQGGGIGAQVVIQTIDTARKAGLPLTLSVLKINPAKRLYDRLGFTMTHENDWSYGMRIDPEALS